MTKNKRYYIIIVLLLTIFTFSNTVFALTKNSKHVAKKNIPKQKVIQKENSVSLDVLGNTYNTKIKVGTTVYDAMKTLQDTKKSNFSFHSRDYSSLGSFVDEINGVKGTPGKYWIYYINNKKASLGISKYILKTEDHISWKQESF